METLSPAPEPTADHTSTSQPSADPVEAGLKHCARVLLNLVDMGHELAAMVLEEAKSIRENAPPVPAPTTGPTPTQHAAAAYDRVTRSIRRTAMLYDKLGKPAKNRANRIAARKRIIRDVEDAIAHHAHPEEQEALRAEFLERLDSPDLDDEIAERPVGDIVTDINRDLGIADLHGAHPWKRRIPHDIAVLNALAEQTAGAGPSEKLTALLATAPPRPTRPPEPPAEDYAAMDMKTLMRRAGLLRES